MPAIVEADAVLAPRLTNDLLREFVDFVPEEWLQDGFCEPGSVRAAYVEFQSSRLGEPRGWVRALREVHEQAV